MTLYSNIVHLCVMKNMLDSLFIIQYIQSNKSYSNWPNEGRGKKMYQLNATIKIDM